MTITVVAAGDHFVLPAFLRDAIEAASDEPLEVRELTLPWPDVPFGKVGEVDEASGTEEQLIAALEGARICLTQMAPLTERVLAASPDLRLFCVGRGGPVNVNVPAATAHGVGVCSAPGRNAAATAEHTVALMLAAMRRIPQVHHELAAGNWRSDYYRYDRVGLELENRTVGLIGFGAIGSRVARVLAAFGARVLVHDPYVEPSALGEAAISVGLDELISGSQIVSLHARLTDETRGLIDAKRIAAMPRGAVLVNCARGALVDYDAVCDALDDGHLFAAAFDVFPTEPIPRDSRLLRTPGIVMTPHLAGASRETAHKAAAIVAADAARYLRGERLLHCVNPEALQAR
jgi:D-3-phosphoglycerate dehydrogenase / 2-oxoglutarate reductase